MVRFEQVSLRYDDGPDIFSHVNFNLSQGGFTFLTGASGAGKTSLLRLIFLANQPSTGDVFLFDRHIATLPRHEWPFLRRKMGIVFQEFRLLDHLSIYDNVALPLHSRGQNKDEYHRNVLELLDWVGLADKYQASPSTLSGGEQQRAAIARAVIGQPRIIIADEPTGNVDADMGMRLMHLFIELNKLGTSIIIATHDQHLWQEFPYPRLHLADGSLTYIPALSAPDHSPTKSP